MCLSIVSRNYPEPNHTKVTKAWKVFKVKTGPVGFCLPYFPLRDKLGRARPLKWDVWLRSTDGSLRADYPSTAKYSTGFHVFTTKKAAKRCCVNGGRSYIVLPVEVRGVTTKGLQSRLPCLVAKWMRIVRPKRRKS